MKLFAGHDTIVLSIRRIAGASVCAVLAAALVVSDATADDEPDPGAEGEQEQVMFRGMPADEGRVEVFGFCGSCHSIDLVLQQGLSRKTWDEVLIEMVEEQEMVALQPEIREKILDYLEKYYGPGRRARKESGG